MNKTDTKKLAVVIPNWNGVELLPSCLAAVQRQTLKPARVIVVDNGSEDESVELLAREYPWVEVITLEKNYGFAGGVNRGIEAARTADIDAIALLNTDAEPEPQWLEGLWRRMQADESLAAAAAKQLDYTGCIDSAGEELSIWGVPFSRGRGETDQGQYEEPTDIFAATGGASLYRVQALRTVGLLDERFFAYFEDVDWCFRARLQEWNVAYEPTAVVHHQVGATSDRLGGFRLYHMYKNFWLLNMKNLPAGLLLKYGWRILGVFVVKLAKLLISLRLWTLVKVIAVSAYYTPGLLLTRWQLQRSRQVKPNEIDKLLYHGRPPRADGS